MDHCAASSGKKIATTGCVMTQKSAVLNYCVVEARNHALSEICRNKTDVSKAYSTPVFRFYVAPLARLFKSFKTNCQ